MLLMHGAVNSYVSYVEMPRFSAENCSWVFASELAAQEGITLSKRFTVMVIDY